MIVMVDDEFLEKVDYIEKINGYKNKSDTVRKTIEKEYRKEKEKMSKLNWHYSAKERPTKEGTYLCVLLHNVPKRIYKDDGMYEDEKGRRFEWGETEKVIAEVETRYFGCEPNDAWVMRGEPWTPDTMVWTEQTGSYEGERVWAWAEMDDKPDMPLPEGVEYVQSPVVYVED